jgi:hypothetical protein
VARAEYLLRVVLPSQRGDLVIVNLASKVGAQGIVCHESIWEMNQNRRSILVWIFEEDRFIDWNII